MFLQMSFKTLRATVRFTTKIVLLRTDFILTSFFHYCDKAFLKKCNLRERELDFSSQFKGVGNEVKMAGA